MAVSMPQSHVSAASLRASYDRAVPTASLAYPATLPSHDDDDDVAPAVGAVPPATLADASDDALQAPSVNAMSELYRQVQTIYKNVKETGDRIRRSNDGPVSTTSPNDDSRGGEHSFGAVVPPLAQKKGRGRSPQTAAPRKPWGYNAPRREPSPKPSGQPSTPRTQPRVAGRSVTPLRDAEEGVVKPGMKPPLAQRSPVRGPSKNRHVVEPVLDMSPAAKPIGPRSRSAGDRAAPQPHSTTPPTATKLPRVAMLAKKTPPRSETPEAPRAALTALEATVAKLVGEMASISGKLSTVEAENERLSADNEKLSRQVSELMQARDADKRSARLAEQQRTEEIMNLGSQVQFAIAWIQQVDRHITTNDECDDDDDDAGHATASSTEGSREHLRSTAMPMADNTTPQSNTSSAATASSSAVSDSVVVRRLDMSSDDAVKRLPPSPPVQLHQQ